MYVQQLYTACLSEAAYYIESEGKAAIIDPLRDIQTYIDLANERNATITYIFETHFHADFVSGHLDLSQKTGAPIVYGPETHSKYKVHIAKDGEIFEIGALKLKVLHTPGHTVESTCYLLNDETSKPYCIFTGDTLFAGDVGRPDLSSGNHSSEELASMLFDSLQEKIKPLEDHIIVYPAHGPGSSCGKNIGPHTYSTIGTEKKSNYALLAENKPEFIESVTAGLGNPPGYFMINAKINQEGYEPLDNLKLKSLRAIAASELQSMLKSDNHPILIDTRNAQEFVDGYVPESIFLGLEGRIAEWAGILIPYNQDIVLITEKGKEEESVIRLARVGFENIIGYLDGGVEAWRNASGNIDLIINVEADELAMDIPFDENLVVMDVRKPSEFEASHVKDAVNLPLSNLIDPASMAMIEDTDNLYVHCAGGYRSVIAASLLKRQGIHNLRNVVEGWKAIEQEDRIEKVSGAFVEPEDKPFELS
jgi:glyoxylase-like metal-dependent hydrolase (beta-lactamase superfamily II)/rhodanese-related sulfurtransferase